MMKTYSPTKHSFCQIGGRLCTLFGREKLASAAVYCRHMSISRQHAALVFNRRGHVLLIDLDSTHGTQYEFKH
eukprot:1390264-Amorphochlora_amoeboformis.AAC.1